MHIVKKQGIKQRIQVIIISNASLAVEQALQSNIQSNIVYMHQLADVQY